MTTITCYVVDGRLYTYDTAEVIRRATADERRASDDGGETGAFRATVSLRTLRQKCPQWVRMVEDR